MDSTTKSRVNEAIEKGMALLDDRIPNWREKIDLTSLDLKSPEQCVLGEVYADTYDTREYVSPYSFAIEHLDINPSEYGFDNDFGLTYVPYSDLTEAWKVKLEGHVDYPHHPGFLQDCPGCHARCHCEEDSAMCVWEPHINNFGGFLGEDRFGRHAEAVAQNREDRS